MLAATFHKRLLVSPRAYETPGGSLMRVCDINQFMDARAHVDTETSVDPVRLRFLTENFASLQGLNQVVLGVVFLLQPMEEALHVYCKSWPIPWWLTSDILVAVCIAAFRWVPNYYQRRFGCVEQRSPSNRQVVIFLLALIVLFVFKHRIDLMISAIAQRFRFHRGSGLLLFWIAILCTDFLRRPRQVDKHRVYFLACVILACFVVVLYPLWNPHGPHVQLWQFVNSCAFGISLVVLGVFDHLTLVRLLPQPIPDSDNE